MQWGDVAITNGRKSNEAEVDKVASYGEIILQVPEAREGTLSLISLRRTITSLLEQQRTLIGMGTERIGRDDPKRNRRVLCSVSGIFSRTPERSLPDQGKLSSDAISPGSTADHDRVPIDGTMNNCGTVDGTMNNRGTAYADTASP